LSETKKTPKTPKRLPRKKSRTTALADPSLPPGTEGVVARTAASLLGVPSGALRRALESDARPKSESELVPLSGVKVRLQTGEKPYIKLIGFCKSYRMHVAHASELAKRVLLLARYPIEACPVCVEYETRIMEAVRAKADQKAGTEPGTYGSMFRNMFSPSGDSYESLEHLISFYGRHRETHAQ
jgi:hypothetical protein